MLFWIGKFIFLAVIWLIFADRRRWKEILPVCLFASCISLWVDQLCELFELWEYYPIDPLSDLLNSLDVYIVVIYLYIQHLPNYLTAKTLLKYIFYWTTVTIFIEYIHVRLGYMKHHNWNYIYSYLANWVLFFLFYKYYIMFKQK